MKIRHILVQHQFEAQDLLHKIERGEDFEMLARKHSSCPSAPQGGDLGDLSKKMDKLDENFKEACESLSVGGISKPVRTRFGHHLIKRYG